MSKIVRWLKNSFQFARGETKPRSPQFICFCVRPSNRNCFSEGVNCELAYKSTLLQYLYIGQQHNRKVL